MLMYLLLLEILIWFASPSSSTSIHPSVLVSDSQCNGTSIAYPFGIKGISQARDGFELSCNATQGGPLMLALGTSKFQVLDVSLEGYVRILVGAVAWRCSPHGSPNPSRIPGEASLSLQGTPYTFNDTANKFTVLGCDALALIHGSTVGHNSTGGCASFCYAVDNMISGSCTGVGCCQGSLPKGLKSFDLQFSSIRNVTGSSNQHHASEHMVSNSNGTISYSNLSFILDDYIECSKAFILEEERFMFSTGHLKDVYEDTYNPVVLDWAIGTETCQEARKNSTSFACMDNSMCVDSPTGVGYRCNCSEGYAGNPYLTNGCEDVNECADPGNNPCVRTCVNTIGSFHCLCPLGTSGDGRKQGTGCRTIAPLVIGVGVGSGLLVMLLVGSLLAYWVLKRRKVRILKEKYFIQNGGLFLQQHISSRQASARIFSLEELEKATDNFNDSRVLGQGGYGTVYKGILEDQKMIAIKKSKLVDKNQIEQFINEVVILSQINHKNVVKLLGCCLECEVPMLVYEFISNGNLFNHIHNKRPSSLLSWKSCLRIATDTAAALSYLHSATSTPIIHRDVKPANILLDEHYTAKVSDFGASRLVPFDQTHVLTVVQGTLGYLDPEYFQTGMLTAKSDVYSFGMVIVELIMREKPISFSRVEEERNLAEHFILLVEENRLVEVVDRQILNEVGARHLVAVSQLAKKCLNLRGEERPTMKEVAVELDALRRLAEKSFIQQEKETVEHSSCTPSNLYNDDKVKEYSADS